MKVNRQGQASVLTKEQECAVLEAMALTQRQAVRNIALLQLGMYSGMRINELRLLNIGDLVNERGEIMDSFALRAETTKTKKSRTVFTHPISRAALKEYLATRNNIKPGDPLFLSEQKKRIHRSLCDRIFRSAFKTAGLTGYSTHSMRRTLVTRMAAMGIQIKVISRYVGHSNLAITDRYIDITDEQMREAAMKL
jgi:integrase/recombinase XerD